jgi:ribosomal protein S27E
MTGVGERVRCTSCGTEIIVVKAPTAALSCCGRPLVSLSEEGASGGQQPR